YDAGIAAPGKFSLTLHTNFTPDGARAPAFPGAIVSNHSFDGGFEWAYGARPWLELGVYMPLYGANFEFSYNSARWDSHRYSSEIRPIIGWHVRPWDFIFNPILDNSWAGGIPALEFNPAARVAYHVNSQWAVAAEHYSGFGTLHELLPHGQQVQQIWAAFDHYSTMNIEGGVGFGLTPASDKITLKLMFSRDLP